MSKTTLRLSIVMAVLVVVAGAATWLWADSAGQIHTLKNQNQQLNQTATGLQDQLSRLIGEATAFQQEVDKIVE